MKLAVLFCTIAALAAAQDTATLEGGVVNKVTGAGIGGATVRFSASRAMRYEAKTDETGAFRITALKPATMTLVSRRADIFLSIPTRSSSFPTSGLSTTSTRPERPCGCAWS